MIEKIPTNVKWHQLKEVISDDQIVIDQIITRKINELVDAVNKMQTMFDAYTTRFRQLDAESKKKIVNGFKNSQDPYAEQRKWVGRVCKFWNVDKDNATYGILEEVVANWACRFKAKDDQYLWDHCEPVRPDDDVIYKDAVNELKGVKNE